MTSAIVMQRLTKDYGSGHGLFDLDLEVAEGEVFGFLGPNGAGKTTTIRLLMGVIHASAGSATIFGLDCDREGRVYFTDVTHGTLQRFIPGEQRYETLLQGEGYFIWPDAVKLGPERIVYVTDSQVNRQAAWNDGIREMLLGLFIEI